MSEGGNDTVLRIDREDLDVDLEVDLAPCLERTLGVRPQPGAPDHAVYQVGSYGPAFADILVDFAVLQEVWRHCRSTLSREVAGLLLGGVWQDSGAPYLHVTQAMDARFTHERLSRVTFTHHTWQDLARRMDALGTEEVMVGWYHTHPGYSVFMSAYDQFIHRNFFGPDGVALVVDPLAGDWGFFQSRGGTVVRVPGFKVVGRPEEGPRIHAFLADLRGTGRPLPLSARQPAEVAVADVEGEQEFRASRAAHQSLVHRFFGALAPEPDAFSAAVAQARLIVIVRGKKTPPGGILKTIDAAIFDLARDHRHCREITLDVRRGHVAGELLCTAEWYQPRRGRTLDLKRQVLTPRMRAFVTWHVSPDRLDVTG